MLMTGIFACHDKAEEPIEPVVPFFKTGPATFVVLGGVIQTFQVVFENLGNVPIEEYGIVYEFAADANGKDPDVTTGTKVVFETPAKTGVNEKTVQIGFPTGAHHLRYRAYAKLKDAEPVKYAESIKLDIH